MRSAGDARVAIRLMDGWTQAQVAEWWNAQWPDQEASKAVDQISYWEILAGAERSQILAGHVEQAGVPLASGIPLVNNSSTCPLCGLHHELSRRTRVPARTPSDTACLASLFSYPNTSPR